MAPARKRRRLPTVIDRGIGLLEIILPHGAGDDPVTTLPPGQRDPGGFWFPAGYVHPGDIFTPAQRKLQAKQRQVQRRRMRTGVGLPPIVSGSGGTAAADTAPSRPHAPPAVRAAAPASGPGADEPGPEAAGFTERSMPLPPPWPEAPEACDLRPQVPRAHGAPPVSPLCRSLSDPGRARAEAPSPVVDSRKGSD